MNNKTEYSKPSSIKDRLIKSYVESGQGDRGDANHALNYLLTKYAMRPGYTLSELRAELVRSNFIPSKMDFDLTVRALIGELDLMDIINDRKRTELLKIKFAKDGIKQVLHKTIEDKTNAQA